MISVNLKIEDIGVYQEITNLQDKIKIYYINHQNSYHMTSI